jgi:hypothetical protein
VFPARYELNSYIVFRKRLVPKRLNAYVAINLYLPMSSCMDKKVPAVPINTLFRVGSERVCRGRLHRQSDTPLLQP